MSIRMEDVRQAGELIQFSLRPRPRFDRDGYGDLLRRYDEEVEFRQVVRELAAGLGLRVLAGNARGFVTAPLDGSVFEMRGRDYRAHGAQASDLRLVEGLVHVAIVATVFPSARDLVDDPTIARQPVTVDEVHTTIVTICDALQGAEPLDPPVDEKSPLHAAWRAYLRVDPGGETATGRHTRTSTRAIIHRALESLRRHGCFSNVVTAGHPAYQATWRYHVMVQQFSADAIYGTVRDLLSSNQQPR